MKASVLKKDKRFEVRNDRSLGVQTYGENNDFPQQVMQIVNASGTGKSCVNIYGKFISGKGFADAALFEKILNRKGQTSDYILEQISKDYAMFGGFALHVNYNANCKITEINYVPFEHVRFEKLDDDGNFNRVALHDDWARQFMSLKRWKKDDITLINIFNPSAETILEQVNVEGGWSEYKGQVYYFSNEGVLTYSTPIFEPVLTDMNTEEGISNVNNRNARNNFLTAGMLVDYLDTPESEEQDNDTEKAILEFQGDENACKIMYVSVKNKDEKPDFVSFRGENYDKEYEITRKTVQENIGKSFSQPPILRSEDIGANFGAELMRNAYNFYNSVIENERLNIERVFTEIFKYWHEPITLNCEIIPLTYDVEMNLYERLGEKAVDKLMEIINSDNKNKKGLIKTMFGLSDEEINELIVND